MTAPSMNLVASGSKRTTVGDLRFDCGPGEFLVASIDLPVMGEVRDASVEHPFVVFSLLLKPPMIAALILETEGVTRSVGFTGLGVSQASGALLDSVIRL